MSGTRLTTDRAIDTGHLADLGTAYGGRVAIASFGVLSPADPPVPYDQAFIWDAEMVASAEGDH